MPLGPNWTCHHCDQIAGFDQPDHARASIADCAPKHAPAIAKVLSYKDILLINYLS